VYKVTKKVISEKFLDLFNEVKIFQNNFLDLHTL